MKRKEFLRGLGLAGVASVLPTVVSKSGSAAAAAVPPPDSCVLIPSEAAGPFPLDLTANTAFFRQDIRESKTGVELNVKLKIIGLANCLPMQNVRVNIWHCDKDGLYSGYDNNQNAGQAGLTYLRGYQMTDASGEVTFKTILPGWYNGRICHIHFQVWVSSIYSAISQLTFPIAAKNAVYAANSGLYTKGADPLTFSSDNIFSDGYALQLATLTPNSSGNGYDTYLEVTVNGSGTLANYEPETGGHFKLGQNFPNPHSGETTVPFTLETAGDVRLDLIDLSGKTVATISRERLAPGSHQIDVNLAALGLPVVTYAFQLTVTNGEGSFHKSKMMTAF